MDFLGYKRVARFLHHSVQSAERARASWSEMNSQTFLLLLALVSLGQCWWSRLPAEGESCTAQVRNPERCAEPESVRETTEPADEMEGFG